MPNTAFNQDGSSVTSVTGVAVNTPVTFDHIATFYDSTGTLTQNSNPAGTILAVGSIGDNGNIGAT